MPGYLLHATAAITCAHPPGQAKPLMPSLRVKLGTQPLVVQTTPYAIAGCALTGTPTPPCVSAQWLTGATRVRSMQVPVLLLDSRSTCVPTGTPLTVLVTQFRVKGI